MKRGLMFMVFDSSVCLLIAFAYGAIEANASRVCLYSILHLLAVMS